MDALPKGDPRRALRDAVRGLRAMGTAFAIIGILFDGMILLDRSPQSIVEQLIVLSATVFLIGPGVLYHISAAAVRRKDSWGARLALNTAIIQCVALLLGILLAAVQAILGQLRFDEGIILIPVIAPVFFVPALIAQSFALHGAMRAIVLLPTDGHGFQPIPLAIRAEVNLPDEEKRPA